MTAREVAPNPLHIRLVTGQGGDMIPAEILCSEETRSSAHGDAPSASGAAGPEFAFPRERRDHFRSAHDQWRTRAEAA